ncbi:MAG TPA: PIN domain-containing protein [Ardenticatenaceae bacterium]|jgi:predicted nucleic acid-binding protein
MQLYLDTSIFGQYADQQQEVAANALFYQIRTGRHQLVLSQVVAGEVVPAPPSVQQRFSDMLPYASVFSVSPSDIRLRDAYLAAGVVTSAKENDALHVAMATTLHCDALISWDERDILRKAERYNQVNLDNDHAAISILSPIEFLQERY